MAVGLLPIRSGTDNGAVTFVDLNSIPRAAIDSIEILKDGASSIYGADAVAGVVNFKFRHDYRGAEAKRCNTATRLTRTQANLLLQLIFGAWAISDTRYHRRA